MERPVEPCDEDCCNSGCNPCVFDVYRRQLELYEKNTSGQLASSASICNIISETKYTTFKITYIKEICESHWIIAFKHSDEACYGRLSWKPGQHFLMKFTNAKSSFSKAYTPFRLPEQPKENFDYDFLIIVKKYNGGLVSNYLCSKLVGEEVLWRGPYGSFDYLANKYKRIFMIAQGTGVMPLYSIIKVVLDNEDDFTSIILLCCYKNVHTCLLRLELYSLKQYWNFNYKLFVRNNDNGITSIFYKEPIEYKKLDVTDIQEAMQLPQNDAFLVCGSSEFMNYYVNNLQNIGVESDRVIHF